MEWTTTSTILEGLGDHANHIAWDRFVARFRVPVVAFARQRGLSESDAEDVAQETLLAFAGALRDGKYERGKGKLSRFLFGIAHRQALNRRRQDARRATKHAVSADSNLADPSPEADASDTWDREWEASVLEQCLRQVRKEVTSTTYRAFELVVRDEVAAQSAADGLGVPIKAVYNAKHRVLKRIRQLREEWEQVD
jgi:RNA polymerase sigma-70 factor (ECF subfamily)